MIKRVFKIILIASAIILFLDTMQNKLAVNAALREAKVTEVLNGNTIKVWMDKEGYEETDWDRSKKRGAGIRAFLF